MIENLGFYLTLTWTNYKFFTRFKIGPILFYLSNVISMIGVLFLWHAIAEEQMVFTASNSGNIITYIFMGRILSLLFFSTLDKRIARDVFNGEYMKLVTKPWDITLYYVFSSLGQTVLHFSWMVVPSVLTLMLTGLLDFDVNLYELGMLILLSLIGLVNVFSIKLMIGYYSVNYTIGYRTLSRFIDVLIQFLGGLWIPIILMPDMLIKYIFVLPFASMGGIQVLILGGFKIPYSLGFIVFIQLLLMILLMIFTKKLEKYFNSKVGELVN